MEEPINTMPNKLPRFIHAAFPPALGAGLILQTEQPLIVGRVILFNSFPEMLLQINQGKFIANAQIPGYSICVIYEGILGRGHRIDGNGIKQAQEIISEMATWYFTERIEASPSRYKRYHIR